MTTTTETQGQGSFFQYPGSPPTRASLTSWWDRFKSRTVKKEEPKENPGIFGVPLQDSIQYAKVAISLTDPVNGNSSIYGYIPIVVAKCGVFLKDKATDVEGIFRLSGSAKRIKDLQAIFNSPDKYGKNLDWTGYTVHDAANIFRRYLNQLPEPIVPLQFYQRFREPLLADKFDEMTAIQTYQHLIAELPALNRQLLLYILDLLAVFSSKSEVNLMPASNLAAIFQPGLLSHPDHDMSPADYRLSQDVLVFLINHQDHFLLGMKGTSDDSVVQLPEGIANADGNMTSLERNPSNASAGAESVRKFGGLRRNVSVSSKRSVSSPIMSSGSLGRSNTLPPKARSPVGTTSPFRGPHSPLVEKKMERLGPDQGRLDQHQTISPENPSKPEDITGHQSTNVAIPSAPDADAESPSNKSAMTRSRSPTPQPVRTPTKERSFPNFFASKSPGSDSEKRTSNKLRKKRAPGSGTPSAESSTTSLPGTVGPIAPVIAAPATITAPPPANPDTQQPPLMPISASPPSSSGNTPSLDMTMSKEFTTSLNPPRNLNEAQKLEDEQQRQQHPQVGSQQSSSEAQPILQNGSNHVEV